jgi:hypothetical protein
MSAADQINKRHVIKTQRTPERESHWKLKPQVGSSLIFRVFVEDPAEAHDTARCV